MVTIRQLGTFDVGNYGDLLYPVVFRRALERRDPRLTLRAYSPLAGDAPRRAGFETRAARELFGAGRAAVRGLVVGGGDLLRTDRETLAAHYVADGRGRAGRLLQEAGAAGSLGYLALRGLARWRADRLRARAFSRRWLSYSATGPFLIDPESPPGGEVCYLSCGAPHEFAPEEREGVARVFERARFVYLRDEQSAEKLRRCGVRRELRVAPDLVVLLGEQLGREAEAAKGRALLAPAGLRAGARFVCFQSKPHTGFSPLEVARQLGRYARRAGTEVVLLPLGHCHGDEEFLRLVAAASGGAFIYADVSSIFDAISVIAACDLFVGTSLHGNVTAFSFGIPHLHGPLPADKTEGFLRSVNLPASLRLDSWDELDEKAELAEGLGRAFFASRAGEARAKVTRVVDELLDALLA